MTTDAVALVVFVLTGAASHHDAGFLVVVARNLLPLGAAWIVAAILLGTYRRLSWAALGQTWAIAVPVGILVRSWIVGSPTGGELVTFLLVGSFFSLLFLMIGRGLLAVAERPRSGEEPA
jgi:hypothetical protein